MRVYGLMLTSLLLLTQAANLPAQGLVERATFKWHIDRIRRVTLSQGGEVLVAVGEVRAAGGRGWEGKLTLWDTASGKEIATQGRTRGGRRFTRNHLRQLLGNVLYTGQVRYKHEVHPGGLPAIVDAALWQEVQTLLRRNPRKGTGRLAQGALLQGLLHCRACACPMIASHTRKGSRRYRYYVCASAQEHGWQTCPAPSVPSGPVEQLVVEQIHKLGPQAAREDCASLWGTLPPPEQARLVRLLVERWSFSI